VAIARDEKTHSHIPSTYKPTRYGKNAAGYSKTSIGESGYRATHKPNLGGALVQELETIFGDTVVRECLDQTTGLEDDEPARKHAESNEDRIEKIVRQAAAVSQELRKTLDNEVGSLLAGMGKNDWKLDARHDLLRGYLGFPYSTTLP